MSKISKHSDNNSEDSWLDSLEKNLEKSAVTTRSDTSLFDQINSIMNNKSKYTSVNHAVDDMMERSGLKKHLDKVKVSKEEPKQDNKKLASKEYDLKVKQKQLKNAYEAGFIAGKRDLESNRMVNTIASLIKNKIELRQWVDYSLGYGSGSQMPVAQKDLEFKKMVRELNKLQKAESEEGVEKLADDSNNAFMKKVPIEESKEITPIIIKKCPQIQKTFENVITDSKGQKSVPAIMQKVKAIHLNDATDSQDWEDDNLIIFVSNMNLKTKKEHPEIKGQESNLGKKENMADNEIDQSNADAFHALNPASFK